MPYAQDHKQNCLKQIQSIENYFKKYSTIDNHNYLLNGLDSLEDIGITIATGLIWSNNRKYRVPFDKQTITYVLKLKIVNTEKISNNYIKSSEKIKDYCDSLLFEDGSDYEIEDFVREAMVKM